MADKKDELTSDPAVTTVQDTVSMLVNAADVSRVYGRPIKQGEVSVIPASENLIFMGFGVGSGSGASAEETEEDGTAAGGAGGGKTLSRPVAIIVATPEGAYVEPVIDLTKIAMAAITAAGFMLGMMLRMTRRR